MLLSALGKILILILLILMFVLLVVYPPENYLGNDINEAFSEFKKKGR